MRRSSTILAVLLIAVFLLNALGPRETVDWTLTFDEVELGDDLDAYLERAEARVPDLKAGTEKTIRWAGAPGERTETAIVYLHGFSASRNDTRPVPEDVAARLGANLFQTRLAGHGRTGPALAGARANDWINDVAEALAIGERLGDRVVVVANSMGATLAMVFAADPRFSESIAGLVLIAPALELQGDGVSYLTRPFARTFVPWFTGPERSWKPRNDDHGNWWTTTYPIDALFPLAALVEQARGVDPATIDTPALVAYSPDDAIVNAGPIAEAVARWGAPLDTWVIASGDGVDPDAHVLVGDILSPGMTDEAIDRFSAWIEALPAQ